MRKKKAIGRPKSANPIGEATYLFKMTNDEYARFKKKAARVGMKFGPWLRHLAEKEN